MLYSLRSGRVPAAVRGRTDAVLRRFPRLEDLGVLAVALVVTAYTARLTLFQAYTYESDARLHEFWMRRFQDPELFHDPLTEALLRSGYIPYGFRGFYWVASWFIDPLRFAELMPLVLGPLAAWLLFRIIRLHTDWRPAAWLGLGLWLLAQDMHRFTGGHQRAFGPVIILLVVYLLLRRRLLPAALVAPVAVLFYPSAGLGALGILAVSSVDRRRPHRLDLERAAWAAGSAVLCALAAFVPILVTGEAPEIISRSQAERYPDFGPQTDVHFFVPSTLDYLSQRASGFDLRWSGSILVVAALALFIARPRNVLLPRREIWAMAIVSLALFGLAQALLFRLYLPHRYVYPLIPFLAIFIALAWRPTWQALADRLNRPWLWALLALVLPPAVAFLALTVFPLGFRRSPERALAVFRDYAPYLAIALAFGVVLALLLHNRRARWIGAAAVAGALLVGEIGVAGKRTPGVPCKRIEVLNYLGTLPKDAIIAGNPVELGCVPVVSKRAVVISEKLFQTWEVHYWHFTRRRMFDSVIAYYGGSLDAVLALRRRYGADYIVVEKRFQTKGWKRKAPFTGFVKDLRKTVETPAVRRLPRECRTWSGDKDEVYDLACVARVHG